MRTLIVLTVASSTLLDVTAARAQAPTRLTLEEAIRRSTETSHRLAEIDSRRAASAAQIDIRGAADRPLVSLQAGYTRTNHVPEFIVPIPTGELVALYPDVPDNARTRIDLQWPIYTGGRNDALQRAARAETDALARDREAARADLKLETIRAYWATATARASVGVLRESLTRMDAHLRDARSRQQAGLVPRSDVLSSEAQRSRQQMLLIEAQNLEESAVADLRRLVGLAPDAAIELDFTLAPPSAPAAAPAALVQQARGDRAERHAIEERIAGANQLTLAAGAGRKPSLTVNGGYDYSRPNPLIFPRAPEWKTSWDITASVNWTIWDGGRVNAERAQAVASRRALEEGLREFDSALESGVRQRRLDLESSLAAISSADDAVRSATEARRVTADRYAQGVATNTETLDAQVVLLQAELDRTRAIANAHLSAARLDRVLGR